MGRDRTDLRGGMHRESAEGATGSERAMSSTLETGMGLKCQNSQAEVALQCGEQWKEVGKTVWGVFDPGRERSSRSEPTGIIVE